MIGHLAKLQLQCLFTSKFLALLDKCWLNMPVKRNKNCLGSYNKELLNLTKLSNQLADQLSKKRSTSIMMTKPSTLNEKFIEITKFDFISFINIP